MSKDRTLSKEEALAKLKQEVRGVILSCPRGLTISQFLKDYKDSIGRSFPFQELGYESIPSLLRDISDVVRLNPSYGGMPSLVPVVNEKVNHINSMVSRQKTTSNKYSHRSVPRRSVVEDSSIRKPVQLPLESKSNHCYLERNTETENVSSSKEHFYNHNGHPEKTRSEKKSNTYEDTRTYKCSSSYDEQDHTRHSSNSNEYPGNLYSEDCYSKVNSDVRSHNSDESIDYYEDQDYVENTSDYIDQSDTGLQNGIYNSESEEDLERPPTPGEVIITEKMKNNFRSLLSEHPEGITSSKFCKLYNEKFRVPLKYVEYGFKSFQEMIVNLPDVFAFRRQKSLQPWILFDARQSVPSSEAQKWIPYDILSNITDLTQNFPGGLKKDELVFLYRERFQADLNVTQLGFNSLESFLESCSQIDVLHVSGEDIVVPKTSYETNIADDEQSYALPPVSEMFYIWGVHFAPDECDPSMAYKPFNLIRKDKINYAKVFACDVISPDNIWLQMDEQREELAKLMLNLNDYYDKFEHKHVMSDYSFAVNDLICAVRFSVDNRWHRAKIISHVDSSNSVLVRYVDYGTENIVDVTSICKLKKKFHDLPVQAVQSCLYGVKPKGNSDSLSPQWTDESVDFIYELCYDKKFSVDVLKMDELIPKLEVILFDGNNALTVNDQLIVAGHAVSVGHMNKCEPNDDRRIRTPPGYSSRSTAPLSPKIIVSTESTCERIAVLRDISIMLHKEVERLKAEIQKKLFEANVLEELICKHHHPVPECYEEIVKLYSKQPQEPAQEEGATNNFNQEPNVGFNPVESNVSASKAGVHPTTFTQESSNSYNHTHQQGFHPMYNTMAGHNMAQPGPESGYNHMAENHGSRQPPQMIQHQSPHPMTQHQHPPYSNYPQQIPPNIMHNKMVGASLMISNQASYVPSLPPRVTPFPRYPQQHNVMFPPQNMNQWNSPWNAHQGMYPHAPYRPDMFPAKQPPAMRPAFNRPSPVPCHPVVEPTNKPIAAPAKPPPVEEVPEEVQQEVLPSAPPQHEVDAGLNVEAAEEVLAPEDEEEEDKVEEAQVQVESEPVSPPATPTRSYDISHLSQKQVKKLENNDDNPIVVHPVSNNWRDLFSSVDDATRRSNLVPSGDPLYPNQTLLELMREDKKSNEILDDEYRKLDDAITGTMRQKKEAVNYIMKIRVENVRGESSNILLVLVGDSVAILLKQLYVNFWLGDLDDESYSELMLTLKDDFALVYSIFYPDYIPIFEKLREEKFIDNEDLYVYLVNLCDVPTALDVICPSERQDLTRVKDIFIDLSKTVLPVDEFWYRSEWPPQ